MKESVKKSTNYSAMKAFKKLRNKENDQSGDKKSDSVVFLTVVKADEMSVEKDIVTKTRVF